MVILNLDNLISFLEFSVYTYLEVLCKIKISIKHLKYINFQIQKYQIQNKICKIKI